MSDLGLVKDFDGKTYLSLQSVGSITYTKNIGSEPKDFEILRELGKGAFGEVFKVRSKLDDKIYAMKKMYLHELREKGEKHCELAKREVTFLSFLSHPHIIKYYKDFTSDNEDTLYIITEYVPNGDLDSFIQAHKKFNKQIPEEELWSIFLQCMDALTYVHDRCIIHRDIKPSNIFLGNNFNIKLGDFGAGAVKKKKGVNDFYKNDDYTILRENKELEYSGTVVGTPGYIAPQIVENKQYDEKVDIFSMGISFSEMLYFHRPFKIADIEKDDYGRVTKMILEKVEYFDDDNFEYSDEIKNLVNSMIIQEIDKLKRAKDYLEIIRTEFAKRYLLNTGVNSTMRCLSTYKEINKYFLGLQYTLKDFQNRPVTKAYISCLKSSEEKWDKNIQSFREVLCTKNPKLGKTKEIDPILVLTFAFGQLHSENNKNEIKQNLSNEHFIISDKDEAKTSKVDMLLNYNKIFSSKFNSFISERFFGLMKKSEFCNKCRTKTYKFSGYFFINFDLPQILQEDKALKQIHIEDYLKKPTQKEITKYCNKCLDREIFGYFKQIYSVCDLIVMSFQRGKDYELKTPIVIQEKISMRGISESNPNKKFKLNGMVCRNNKTEEFFSIINEKGTWFRYEGKESKKMELKSLNIDQSAEEIILLFYELSQNIK